MIEHLDRLHERFTEPTVIENGRYRAPSAPGLSAEMRRESLRHYTYPNGPEWSGNR
jgi:L-fuconate dehydratase